ncbi:PepSY-like domain-containing protein [Terrimonas rubra]|uniref:PepSY-like domain-containing protein n=1 Tax=Terrimonas rubra TaxID=1035890 RepID=A0ABW6A7B2_9BACT
MKKLFTLLLSIFLAGVHFTVTAQTVKESKVPAAVKESFKKQHPDMYVYEWEFKKKKQLYEAEFLHKGAKHEAHFTPDGKWLLTKRDIKRKDLPAKILQAIAGSQYSHWEIDDAEEQQTPSGLVYKVEVEQGKQELYLYITAEGKIEKTVQK